MGHSSHAGRAHEGSTKEPRHKIDETGEDQIPMETCSLYHVLLRLAQDKVADVLFQEYEAEEEEGSRSSKEDDPDGQCLGDTHGVDHPSSDFWVGWAETFGHGELVGVGVMDEVVQGDHEDNGDGHTKVTKSTTYTSAEELGVTEMFELEGNEEGADHQNHGEESSVGLSWFDGCHVLVFHVGCVIEGSIDDDARCNFRAVDVLEAVLGLQRVMDEDLGQLLEGAVDENEAHQRRKDLLGEAGELLDDGHGLEGGDKDGGHSHPYSHPHSRGQEVDLIRLAERVQTHVEDHERARGAHDEQRLGGEQGEDDAVDGGHEQRLAHADVVVHTVAVDAAEGDGGGERGEEDEDGGRQHLPAEAVLDVGQVERVAGLEVLQDAEEGLPGADERIPRRRPLLPAVAIACGGRGHGRGLRLLALGAEALLLLHDLVGLGADVVDGHQVLVVPVGGRQHDGGVQELVDGREQLAARVGAVGHLVEALVGHEGGDGAPHLVVVHLAVEGAQQHEHEAHGDGHLHQVVHHDALSQPDEGDGRLLEEVYGAHQHSRGLGALGDLLEQVLVIPAQVILRAALVLRLGLALDVDLRVGFLAVGGLGVGTRVLGHAAVGDDAAVAGLFVGVLAPEAGEGVHVEQVGEAGLAHRGSQPTV